MSIGLNNQLIEKALEEKELTQVRLAELAGFTESEIKLLEVFWEPAFNKSWMYLSSEIIHDYFGYKKTRSSEADFYRKMKEIYIKDIDYIEVTKNHELVKLYEKFYSEIFLSKDKRGGSLKKYYIISGEAFKKMGIRANTKKGDEMCNYFIKVESLANTMTQYTLKKLEKESKEQIERLERKQLKLESFVKNFKKLQKEQIFYLATTDNYSQQSRFEYGGVKSLKDLRSRLATYNTGRAEGDLYYYCKVYYCHNYHDIEQRIETILKQFKNL